jgi:sulfite reductase (ferredoxin)
MPATTWREQLAGQVDASLTEEIDAFEAKLELRRQGRLEEKVFAESRLRRGVYGQRYDNGHRHDGIQTQTLNFPNGELTKGPETLWDAPGMQRIKIPFGGLNPRQMIVLAELAEEYSDAICHITTRQDVQLHYIHIEDTPPMMRRLAAVGITTREACGNGVRNVTACPIAGVCREEIFDVTPYSKAIAFYLLGHPDTQDFGRKFKIAFSGCKANACALVTIHDLGGIAKTKIIDGKTVRGFELYVGGGLGAVPYQAKLFDEFVPAEELLPLSRAMARVYARLGEKKNRNKARIKFLVAKLGIEEFKRLVMEEYRSMPPDDSWRKYFDQIEQYSETPATTPANLNGAARPAGFDEWFKTNVYRQRQAGFATVTVTLPLGDLSSDQMRALAAMTEKYQTPHVRTTVEQNIVFRWVPEGKLVDFYNDLVAIGLGASGAGTIVDVVACPGTDTCKLGIASSRGLAGELRQRLASQAMSMDAAIRSLRIKISGCFNSCGQHHVADIGFYGNSRNVGGYGVPHFQVMLGGQWTENGASYSHAMGSVPSKRIPEFVTRLTQKFIADRQADESFQRYCGRVGKKALKAMVDEWTKVPPHDVDASYYTDWGDPREFTIGDMAMGECAGEIVTSVQFGFAAAETSAFEAQLALEAGDYQRSDELAYKAMLEAAATLVKTQFPDVPTDPATLVAEFRTRFVETKLFWDRFAHGTFSNYLFARQESPPQRHTKETAHQLADQANLFIDAAHACYAKIQAGAAETIKLPMLP